VHILRGSRNHANQMKCNNHLQSSTEDSIEQMPGLLRPLSLYELFLSKTLNRERIDSPARGFDSMRPILIATAGSFVLLLSALPAAAQLYHLGSDELPNGMLRLFLVNDSDKPIEAFRWVDHCVLADGKSTSASGGGGDSLLYPPESTLIQTYDGRKSPTGRLERDGKWMIGAENDSGCESKIVAVIFSDGSHDGSEDAIKEIVALRKGREDRDRFWLDRLKREQAEGWSVERIRSDAEQVQARSSVPVYRALSARGSDDREPALQAYLGSRYAVDVGIADSLSKQCQCPTPAFLSGITQKLESELARIDADVSRKVLDAEFPMSVLPDDAGQTPR